MSWRPSPSASSPSGRDDKEHLCSVKERAQFLNNQAKQGQAKGSGGGDVPEKEHRLSIKERALGFGGGNPQSQASSFGSGSPGAKQGVVGKEKEGLQGQQASKAAGVTGEKKPDGVPEKEHRLSIKERALGFGGGNPQSQVSSFGSGSHEATDCQQFNKSKSKIGEKSGELSEKESDTGIPGYNKAKFQQYLRSFGLGLVSQAKQSAPTKCRGQQQHQFSSRPSVRQTAVRIGDARPKASAETNLSLENTGRTQMCRSFPSLTSGGSTPQTVSIRTETDSDASDSDSDSGDAFGGIISDVKNSRVQEFRPKFRSADEIPKCGSDDDSISHKVLDKYIAMDDVRVLIVGRTGIGKSTVINTYFGCKKAKTESQMGQVVTLTRTEYSDPGAKLRLIDSRGWELDSELQGDIERDILSYVKCSLPDICWYCKENGGKFDQHEWQLFEELCSQMPVVVLITKTQQGEASSLFQNLNPQLGPKRISLVFVRCVPDVGPVCGGHDLGQAMQKIISCLPESRIRMRTIRSFSQRLEDAVSEAYLAAKAFYEAIVVELGESNLKRKKVPISYSVPWVALCFRVAYIQLCKWFQIPLANVTHAMDGLVKMISSQFQSPSMLHYFDGILDWEKSSLRSKLMANKGTVFDALLAMRQALKPIIGCWALGIYKTVLMNPSRKNGKCLSELFDVTSVLVQGFRTNTHTSVGGDKPCWNQALFDRECDVSGFESMLADNFDLACPLGYVNGIVTGRYGENIDNIKPLLLTESMVRGQPEPGGKTVIYYPPADKGNGLLGCYITESLARKDADLRRNSLGGFLEAIQGYQRNPPLQRIHFMWYCIDQGGLCPDEIDFLKKVKEQGITVIVTTGDIGSGAQQQHKRIGLKRLDTTTLTVKDVSMCGVNVSEAMKELIRHLKKGAERAVSTVRYQSAKDRESSLRQLVDSFVQIVGKSAGKKKLKQKYIQSMMDFVSALADIPVLRSVFEELSEYSLSMNGLKDSDNLRALGKVFVDTIMNLVDNRSVQGVLCSGPDADTEWIKKVYLSEVTKTHQPEVIF